MTSDDAEDGERRAGDPTTREDGGFGPRIGRSAVEPTTTRTSAVSAPAKKSSPLHLLFDDLGLKVVALVLAITTWILVHDQIQIRHSVEGVSVVLDDLPSSIRTNAGTLPRVSVRLFGSAGAVERARLVLEQSGRPLRIRLKAGEGGEGTTTFATASDFTFPFANVGVVEAVTPPLPVAWHRIESLELEIPRPEIDRGARMDIEVVQTPSSPDTEKVTVMGPAKLIGALRRGDVKLAPDGVSAVKWLRASPDFATPFPWTTGFSVWRSKDPDLRSEALTTIEPPMLVGKTKLREYKVTPAKVELALLYPAGLDARAYEKYDVKILDTAYDARTRRLDISVRGDPQLVAGLGAGQSGWTLLVNLPAPPKHDAGSVENYSASVMLVPPEGVAGDTSPRLRLVSPAKVFVTLERRKGP